MSLPGRPTEGIPVSAERATPTQPLVGIRVLELGHIVAGPTAGQILADLGADVLKVESVDGGDQARRMPGATATLFHFFNRNKRSIALDLKHPAGREAFLKLAAGCDVIVDNFAFGAVENLRIGYEVVSATNPSLVWLAIKGFLPGPFERRPMLDELAQMMGGLAFMTGPAGKPMRAGASVIDVGAASYGALGVFAALRQRDATGRGQRIVAGLYETSVYWVGQWMAVAQGMGAPSIPIPEIQQGTRMGWGVYQLFDTADGAQVFIGITSDGHWKKFCAAFEQPGWLADPRFVDNAARVASRHELAVLVAGVVRELTSAVVQQRLDLAGVPFAPLQRPDQLAGDIHLLGSGQLLETPLGDGRTALLPKLPIRGSAFEMPLRRPAPSLGEQTREVLRELGYADADIQALIDRGTALDGASGEKNA